MSDLSILLADDKRAGVLADLASLADATVASQSGVTGIAVKTALAAARKVDAEIVSKALGRLLPELLDALNPHWAAGADDFGAYLAAHADEASNAILQVADTQAEKASNAALKKGYSSLRGKAQKILIPALPELGSILQRHMAA